MLSTVDSKPRSRKGMTYSASLSSLSLFSTSVVVWVGPSMAFSTAWSVGSGSNIIRFSCSVIQARSSSLNLCGFSESLWSVICPLARYVVISSKKEDHSRRSLSSEMKIWLSPFIPPSSTKSCRPSSLLLALGGGEVASEASPLSAALISLRLFSFLLSL